MVDDVQRELQKLVREHYGWALARLVRRLRDLELAEDALQQALEAALVQWPRDGTPATPRAWLIRAAHNKAVDELRKRGTKRDKEDELSWLANNVDHCEADDHAPEMRNDMMRLLFTCCHPALAEEARVALTLKVIAGLTTDEIARAFVVPQATMAQRLVRAKRKIKATNIPYRVPEAHELGERLSGVLNTVYLIFNEGYTATAGDQHVREDLCVHAIRLGHELLTLFPDNGPCRALFALMLLHDARRDTRVDEHGELVLLEAQDRSRWNQEKIARGVAELDKALQIGGRDTFCIQAAIASLHAQAASHQDTDWRQIVGLYNRLMHLAPTPVVALNRAAALAMAYGAEMALPHLESLQPNLSGYHLFHAARADLLRRSKRYPEALRSYGEALELCDNATEQRFLKRRQAEVRALLS